MTRQLQRTLRPVSLLLAGMLAFAALTGCSPSTDTNTTPLPASPEVLSVETTVVRVVDGDTIVVRPVAGALLPTNDAGTQHTVRLLGIDAAEMNYGKEAGPECGARRATHHLEQLLPEGTAVFIVYDANADHLDRYGRSLAYVAVASSSEDVNRAQAADGYAEAWIPKGEPRPERWNDYLSAAEQAKWQKKGAYGAPENCATLGRQ